MLCSTFRMYDSCHFKKNAVQTGVINVSTLNMNMSKLLTHALAKTNYSPGLGSSTYCDATNKN